MSPFGLTFRMMMMTMKLLALSGVDPRLSVFIHGKPFLAAAKLLQST
jgi:hypothetical protein